MFFFRFRFIMYLVLALLKVALVNFTLNKYMMMIAWFTHGSLFFYQTKAYSENSLYLWRCSCSKPSVLYADTNLAFQKLQSCENESLNINKVFLWNIFVITLIIQLGRCNVKLKKLTLILSLFGKFAKPISTYKRTSCSGSDWFGGYFVATTMSPAKKNMDRPLKFSAL